MAVQLTADQQQIAQVMAALKSEADGKALRREIGKRMRLIVEPAVGRAKNSVLALPSKGTSAGKQGGSLRQSIATRIKAETRAQGRDTGVAIRVKGTGTSRNFRLAGRRLNQRRTWRHPVFGNREIWVEVTNRNPGWFDEEVSKDRDQYRNEILAAVEEMAERIARRASAGAAN